MRWSKPDVHRMGEASRPYRIDTLQEILKKSMVPAVLDLDVGRPLWRECTYSTLIKHRHSTK